MQAEEYIAYLLRSPTKSSCVQAGEVLSVSHNEVNRFLLSGSYQASDLFEAVKDSIDLVWGSVVKVEGGKRVYSTL